MSDPKLSEEARLRIAEKRLSHNATDDEVAAAFVYGAGNLYQDNIAAISLVSILAQIRGDERRKVAASLNQEANRIFNKQVQDYPSNVLDKVANHLRSGEPLSVAGIVDKQSDAIPVLALHLPGDISGK